MKLLFTLLCLVQFAYGLDKNTMADLKKYTGTTASYIRVMTGPEKGNFYKYTGTRKPDGGIIVKDARGQLWEREWPVLQLGVLPEFWGAWGDRVHDDILALEAAKNYITYNDSFGGNETSMRPFLFLGGGYRISRQFKHGGAPLSPKDALWYQIGDNRAASYSQSELSKVGTSLPFSIYGATRAYIWGDFEPDSLTAIVSLGASGWNYGGLQYQSTVISGLTVLGKHHFDYTYVGTHSKQVGLIMYGGNHITVSNFISYGVKEGLISNTQYVFKITQSFFGNCGRGFFSLGSHGSEGDALMADHCDLGYEIVSNQCVFTLNSEQCKRALVTSQDNKFIGGYLEQMDATSGPEDYQVQVGYPRGHPFANDTFLGVSFDGTVVTAKNQKHYLIEEATTSYENITNVAIVNKMTFGYNKRRNPKTIVRSEGIQWIVGP